MIVLKQSVTNRSIERHAFNASHSYCVAEDSLYTAWLKSNYPLQFYETFLRILENKGDKDRMNAVKDEAEDYFHFQIASVFHEVLKPHSIHMVQSFLHFSFLHF